MSKHSALIEWHREADEVFSDNQYSRAHIWKFDGGLQVPASPSPHVVPLPLSVEETLIRKKHLLRHFPVVTCLFFSLLRRNDVTLWIAT